LGYVARSRWREVKVDGIAVAFDLDGDVGVASVVELLGHVKELVWTRKQ